MALSSRDRRALMALAVAAPLLLLFLYGKSLLRLAAGGSEDLYQRQEEFNQLYARMQNYDSWQSEIEKKQASLHIAVNHDSADNQKDKFVEQIEGLGAQSEVRVSRYRWVSAARRTRGVEVRKETLLLDCNASFPNLIRFVRGIEGLTTPVVIDKINLSKPGGGGDSNAPQGGGRGGGGSSRGGGRQDSPLTISLQLHVYLFPEGEI